MPKLPVAGIPDGLYLATITGVEYKFSKAGNPMLQVEFTLEDGQIVDGYIMIRDNHPRELTWLLKSVKPRFNQIKIDEIDFEDLISRTIEVQILYGSVQFGDRRFLTEFGMAYADFMHPGQIVPVPPAKVKLTPEEAVKLAFPQKLIGSGLAKEYAKDLFKDPEPTAGAGQNLSTAAMLEFDDIKLKKKHYHAMLYGMDGKYITNLTTD